MATLPKMMTIGIFPASGSLATSTYRHLLKLVPGEKVTLASYESAPEELEKAFAGVHVLLLISYPSHVHEYRVTVQLPAIDAARRAGVKHIFYTSLAFAGAKQDKSLAVVMQAHLDTESHLRKAAAEDPTFTYTFIREGIYSESFPIYTAFFDPSDTNGAREILIPHDGTAPGIVWVKRDELGEASAKLLADYARDPDGFSYVNGTVLLTGSRAWSLQDTAELLKDVGSKKDIRIRQVSVDEYAAQPQVLARFGSEEKARTWATAWDAIRAGETAVVSPELEQILGRRPEEFDTTIRRDFGRTSGHVE